MRSISFEKLRRLVGRKKDRNEPSFKRSESFKRISIRKSYLDRGKRRTKVQQQKINDTGCNNNERSISPNNFSTTTILVEEHKVENDNINKIKNEEKKENILYEIDDMKIGGEVKFKNSNSSLRTTITYDDWLNDINDGSIKEIFYDDEKVPDELLSNYDDISVSEKTEESLDLSEDFEALRLTSMSSYSRSTLSDVCSKSMIDDIESVTLGENGPPSVSVSLGRVWLGAALMPFPSVSSISSSPPATAAATSITSITASSTTSTPSIASVTCVSNSNNNKSHHRSLDSAWKEHNKSRYETSSSSSQITVARTVSAPEKSQIINLSNSTSKIGDCSKLKKTGLSLFGKKKIRKSKGGMEIVPDNDNNLQLNPERFNFVLPEKRKLKKASHVWQEIRFCSIFEPSIDTVDTPITVNNSNTSTKNYKEFLNSCSNHDNQMSDEEIFHYQTFKSSSTYSKSSIVSDVISPHGPKISDFNEDKILSEKLRGILAQRPVWQPNEKKLQKKYTKKIQKKNNKNANVFNNNSSCHSINSVNLSSKKVSVNNYYRCLSSSDSSESNCSVFNEDKYCKIHDKSDRKNRRYYLSSKRRSLSRKKSQRQPVYLVRKCSLLKRQSSKKKK